MLLGDVRWLHSFDKKRRIRRILKIRRGREREKGEDQSMEKFPKTRFYGGSSEHQVVKGDCEVKKDEIYVLVKSKFIENRGENRKDLGRKENSFLIFSKILAIVRNFS